MGLAQAIAFLPLVPRRPPCAAPTAAAVRTAGLASPPLPPDPRRATVRQLAEFGFELQIAGELDFADSQLLSRAPELHPAYARTVGRLTGDREAHDCPGDQLERWEDRLDFAERHGTTAPANLDRIRRVLRILRRTAARRDVAARSRRGNGR